MRTPRRIGDEPAQQVRQGGPGRVSVEGRHNGVADSDLTVADQAVLGRDPPELLTPERLGHEVEEGPVPSVTVGEVFDR